jgi:hypothetical protein
MKQHFSVCTLALLFLFVLHLTCEEYEYIVSGGRGDLEK